MRAARNVPVASTAPSPLASALAREEALCREHELDPACLERALLGPAREFLGRPGKAFRARLVEAAYALSGGTLDALPAACVEAVELLHAGSLIVDDIQDDATERRGGPALHRVIGMPSALNVGNWLYFVALSRLDELELDAHAARALTRAAHRCLARCHEGQALDLTLRLGEVRRHEAEAAARTTSSLKTGALMGFAARLGATAAHASDAHVLAFERFGARIGVGLQMLDDLGSFVSPARHDKALEDLRGERVSWVWAWASETMDELAYRQLVQRVERKEQLDGVIAKVAEHVAALGRARVRAALDEAFDGLRRALGPGVPLDGLSRELSRLEKSYG